MTGSVGAMSRSIDPTKTVVPVKVAEITIEG